MTTTQIHDRPDSPGLWRETKDKEWTGIHKRDDELVLITVGGVELDVDELEPGEWVKMRNSDPGMTVEDHARQLWHTLYPDRRPWEEIEPEARAAWIGFTRAAQLQLCGDLPVIVQLPMTDDELAVAEELAKRLGYSMWSYGTTSDLCGLFCLPGSNNQPGLTIVNTLNFGLMVMGDLQDYRMGDMGYRLKP